MYKTSYLLKKVYESAPFSTAFSCNAVQHFLRAITKWLISDRPDIFKPQCAIYSQACDHWASYDTQMPYWFYKMAMGMAHWHQGWELQGYFALNFNKAAFLHYALGVRGHPCTGDFFFFLDFDVKPFSFHLS